jgi:type IV pilus assembly protein PilM
MALASKVLSIEVGQATTRVVEMDFKTKNPKIYNMFTVETPEDVIQDGVVAHSEEFIVSIKGELRRRMIKTTRVIFSVSSNRIANREARIPVCKERNIMPLIMANASDYFPVDMNQYHLVYTILGTVDGNEGKQYRLSLLAVPNDVTTSYVDLSRSLGLEIKAIDYVGNAVYQAVREDIGDATAAFLKIEEHSTLITIMSGGEIVLQRLIAHGLNQAIQNLMESDMFRDEELTYEAAARKFTENKIVRPHLNLDAGVSAEDANEEDLMVRVMITESLRYLVGNTGRVLEYFISRNEDKPINNVYLLGLGSDFQGLPELLTNELGFNVQAYRGLDKYSVVNADPSAPKIGMSQVVAPIGTAIQPLQLLSSDLLKGEKEINLLIPGAVMVAGIGIGIVMFIFGQIMVKAEEHKTNKLQKTLDSYDYVAEVIEKYDNSQLTYAQLQEVFGKSNTYNNELTAFLEEIEKKMPDNLRIETMTATTEGVTMVIDVASKPEAAKLINQFRTFDTVNLISAGSVKEENIYAAEVTEDEDGNTVTESTGELIGKKVNFTVTLTYKMYGVEETEEGTESTTEATN